MLQHHRICLMFLRRQDYCRLRIDVLMFKSNSPTQKVNLNTSINTNTPRILLEQKDDVGQIRTDAPEGTRFLVLRDNHSATTPPDATPV